MEKNNENNTSFFICFLVFINCSRRENTENIINNEINVEYIQNEYIEKYITDTNFGRIYNNIIFRDIVYGFNWEYIDSLGGDTPLEYCVLEFINGKLNTIIVIVL